MELPSIQQILLEKPEKKAELEQLKSITATQQLAEQNSRRHESQATPAAIPESIATTTNKYEAVRSGVYSCPHLLTCLFHRPPSQRLFLAQLGYLHNKNRTSVIPLKITDSLISELETLDLLNE